MWISEAIVAWSFLGVSLVGAVFTLNAFVPVRRIPALFVPSFFGSWLTAELALHHIVWQAIATLLFVQFGALSSWPGIAGMFITILSWLGLLVLFHVFKHLFHRAGRRLAGVELEDDLRSLSDAITHFHFNHLQFHVS